MKGEVIFNDKEWFEEFGADKKQAEKLEKFLNEALSQAINMSPKEQYFYFKNKVSEYNLSVSDLILLITIYFTITNEFAKMFIASALFKQYHQNN